MFDNIGWLMYAYTRLDVIHHTLVVLFAISVAIGPHTQSLTGSSLCLSVLVNKET